MEDSTLRAAIVGGGVAALPFVWQGFCKLLHWALFQCGRLVGILAAKERSRRAG